jgi:hypothetical protein
MATRRPEEMFEQLRKSLKQGAPPDLDMLRKVRPGRYRPFFVICVWLFAVLAAALVTSVAWRTSWPVAILAGTGVFLAITSLALLIVVAAELRYHQLLCCMMAHENAWNIFHLRLNYRLLGTLFAHGPCSETVKREAAEVFAEATARLKNESDLTVEVAQLLWIALQTSPVHRAGLSVLFKYYGGNQEKMLEALSGMDLSSWNAALFAEDKSSLSSRRSAAEPPKAEDRKE